MFIKPGKNLIDSTRFLPKSQLSNGVVASANVYCLYSVPVPRDTTIYWSKATNSASIGGLADSAAEIGVAYYDSATNTNRTSYTWQTGEHPYLLLMMGNTNTDGGQSRSEMVRLNENDLIYELPTGTTLPSTGHPKPVQFMADMLI